MLNNENRSYSWYALAVRRRCSPIALVVLALTATLAACGGAEKPANASGKVDVVAAFYPLAFAAEQIGGSAVSVVNLTPPGVEPHDLELSPGDVELIRNADVVLYLGDGFQPAVEEAAQGSGEPVDLLDTLELREGGDPHVWLDPLRYAAIAERLGPMLKTEDAAAAFADRLRELDRELDQGLADCERRAIVTSHDAFGYLAERYALTQVPVTGIEPEAEPVPREVAEVVAQVRASGATTVYVEPLVSQEIAETVAREAGIEVATLNPLEGLTEEEEAAGEDYFSVMRANLAALREGLGCR
jgi:zinc transport system substrate-binding protein